MKSNNRDKKVTTKKQQASAKKPSNPNHKKDFDQLLDDSIHGVRKKK
jgi:hypothetical protein